MFRTNEPTTPEAHRRGPSRGFWIGMLGVVLFALALTLAGAVAASRSEDDTLQPGQQGPAPTVEVSYAPRITTPPDNYAANPE